MTNRMSELQKRILTALIGGTLLVAMILLGQWVGMVAFVLLLCLGSFWELSDQLFKLEDAAEKRLLLFGLSWCWLLFNIVRPQAEGVSFFLASCFVWAYLVVTVSRWSAPENFKRHFEEGLLSLLCLFYTVALPLLSLRLYEGFEGKKWVFWLFSVLWSGDSAAYFIGKKYGRRLLLPSLSPKKTLEGAIGGLFGSLLTGCLFSWIVFEKSSFLFMIFLTLTTAFLGQVGDLFESFLKRVFGIKDSGHLLPGHGGFLDRFDSFLFTLPWVYSWVRIFT